jgi:3-oxoacyl-[acyl-carrier protein] reductase
MGLAGRVAIVTGGGGGIGRGVAIELARHGAFVVAAGIHHERVEEVRLLIEAEGGTCRSLEVDISDNEAVEAMVERTLAEFGRIDVLVNSAAHRARGPVLEMTDQEWLRVIDVNLNGTFYLTRAVARPMVAQRSGTMILFASDRALFGGVNGANYAASKGGVIAYTKSLALELGQHGVTVNAINPGTIPTERPGISAQEKEKLEEHRARRAAENPLGRTNTVEEIAEYVRWFAETGGSFITGQLVTVRSVP